MFKREKTKETHLKVSTFVASSTFYVAVKLSVRKIKTLAKFK
jgi:hypothetical protein